jgi:hypothetical protein
MILHNPEQAVNTGKLSNFNGFGINSFRFADHSDSHIVRISLINSLFGQAFASLFRLPRL